MATTIDPAIQNMYDEQMKFNRNMMKYLRRIVARLDDPDGTKAAERSKNNAFNRPMKANETLCEFMGVDKGTEVSRADGNKAVYAYIRENNLKSPNDGRMFTPDDKLCKTFGIPKEEMMTLGVSKYISKCLVPVTPTEPADAADANGDGRVTRSEAQEHALSQASAVASGSSPKPPSQPKKTPTKTTKSATIRAPKKKTPTAA